MRCTRMRVRGSVGLRTSSFTAVGRNRPPRHNRIQHATLGFSGRRNRQMRCTQRRVWPACLECERLSAVRQRKIELVQLQVRVSTPKPRLCAQLIRLEYRRTVCDDSRRVASLELALGEIQAARSAERSDLGLQHELHTSHRAVRCGAVRCGAMRCNGCR